MSTKRPGTSSGNGKKRSARAKAKTTGARGPASIAKSKAAAKARRVRVEAVAQKKAARARSESARRLRERDDDAAEPRSAPAVRKTAAARGGSGARSAPAPGRGAPRPAKGTETRAPRRASTVIRGERAATTAAAPAGAGVDELLQQLDHPLTEELQLVRSMILGVSPEISEIVKWSAPSFRTHEDFATMNLRYEAGVQIVFHLGARTRPGAVTPTLDDPRGLVKWLAKDRCLVTLGAGKEVAANREAFEAIVRAWIRAL